MAKRVSATIAVVLAIVAGAIALVAPAGNNGNANRNNNGDVAQRLNPTDGPANIEKKTQPEVKGTQTGLPPGPDSPVLPTTPAQPTLTEERSGPYPVASISDGDTIRVTIDGKNHTVRLVGVDTPEIRAPGKPVQCYARQASAHTKRLAASSLVYLEPDGPSADRDRYGRLLRYVYLTDGRMLQEELLRDGSAFMYPNFRFEHKERFASLQAEAQAAKVGVWRDCTPIPAKNGGFTSNAEGQSE